MVSMSLMFLKFQPFILSSINIIYLLNFILNKLEKYLIQISLMKTRIIIAALFLSLSTMMDAQIITPVVRGNFGVDADLRVNFFNGLVQSGNDDWFKMPFTTGTGQFVVDTNGSAAIVSGYTSNPLSRQLPFFRSMRFLPYSVINNRLLVDAYFVRDYHGDDSTIFASGSNKNGMSPVSWSCPVSQSIPDKNEILDIMLHVRRAGPNTTDSLWMMGGISIENTTGNRYFDFEMYQTDIYYDRTTRKFYNYGPDAGHTRWQFDASGNMTKPGDIILTAEYSSSALTSVEARIWINKNDLTANPIGFTFTGSFDGDGAGAQYGYAGIVPKTVGAFYTGLQSLSNTWAGPFALVTGDNNVYTTYTARQYMEFSVNLSKLGLDQAQIFGGDDCLMPFRRVVVKTRASTSFTSELKDFVAPFDFFIAPKAEVETTTPFMCSTGTFSNIYVMNPIATSIYEWTALTGRIVGGTTGTSINVDTAGVYIVKQYLQAGCSVYATDTISIKEFEYCGVLANNAINFSGLKQGNQISLTVKTSPQLFFKYLDYQRSIDGINFETINRLYNTSTGIAATFIYNDNIGEINASKLYYRVVFNQENKNIVSNVISYSLSTNKQFHVKITPNPVIKTMYINIFSPSSTKAILDIYNTNGELIISKILSIQLGDNQFDNDALSEKPLGIYLAILRVGKQVFSQKIYHTY